MRQWIFTLLFDRGRFDRPKGAWLLIGHQVQKKSEACRWIFQHSQTVTHGVRHTTNRRLIYRMASVAAAEGEHQEEDANDEDRAIDPALLEPPASSSYRCVLDRQGALVHWASQRGKVCAAAVVAGAIDSLWQRQEAVTVELALREFQGAWRAAIRELSTTPDSHEKAALLTRLTASYQKVCMDV